MNFNLASAQPKRPAVADFLFFFWLEIIPPKNKDNF